MRKLFLLLLLPFQLAAQNNSFASFKHYPFPTELCAAPKAAKIAWAFDELGVRNVYVAEGPVYTPRKLTGFPKNCFLTTCYVSNINFPRLVFSAKQ